jgi:hypothetical protein
MSPFKSILLGMCAAAMLTVAVSSVSAQYYVPLRYDLRMSGPQYPVVPAANPDPYAFGQPNSGNLGMTGNLRFGKSFQGPVPYNQSGSQLFNTQLPSLTLSNFRRDSYGADDIGSVTSYGAAQPYVPRTAQVTNPTTAERPAFARDPSTGVIRPTYLPAPVTARPQAGTQAEQQALLGLTGAPSTAALPQNIFNAQGLTVSRGTYEWINALIESGRESERARTRPSAESSVQVPEDLPPPPPANLPSYRFPGQTELERLAQPQPALQELPGSTQPQNMLTPLPPGYRPYERPQPSNVLNTKGPLPLPSTPEESAPTPATPRPAAKGPASFGPTPAPGTGPGQPSAPPGSEKAASSDLSVAPIPNVGSKTYADYFTLGEKAMKEGRFDYAEGMFAAAAALDRSKADALFGRASAMVASGRHVEAGYALGAALKAHPEWVKSIPNLKAAYPKSDQWDRVFEDVTADLEKSPDSPVLQFMVGYVLYAGGQPAAARPYLEKAAALRGSVAGPEQVLLGAMKSPDAK